MSTRNAWIVVAACAVLGLVVLPLVSPETGGTADALWVAQLLVLLVGIVALVVAIRGTLSARRAGPPGAP